jgi:hypothetical protein
MTADEDRAFGEFVENVRSEDYDWFVVLMLPGASSELQSDEYFDLWISTMEEVDGTRSFRWVRVAEKNSEDGSMLLHVLIGGRNTRRRWDWMQGWRLDVTQDGNVYSRRIPETPKLRTFLKYKVERLSCGLRARNDRGGELRIHGADYSSL